MVVVAEARDPGWVIELRKYACEVALHLDVVMEREGRQLQADDASKLTEGHGEWVKRSTTSTNFRMALRTVCNALVRSAPRSGRISMSVRNFRVSIADSTQ